MPQLDNYLVSLGLKGQNVVLSTLEKVRKKGKDLSKKPITIPTNTKAGKGGKSAPGTKPGAQPGKGGKSAPGTKPGAQPGKAGEPSTEKKSSGKFDKAVDKFKNSTTNFANNMSRLDPVHAIESGLSAMSKIAIAGIPFALAQAGLSMASNMIAMAKDNAAAQYGIVRRNATAEYYGGGIRQISRMSNEEQAALRMTVGAAMGKVQRPLADAINKLLAGADNFNTQALARVASGNWASTGTDEGWALQQLSDAFQGLPPSIAQKFQASLLTKYGADMIQKTNEKIGESVAQQANAAWQNRDEEQIAAISATINDPTKRANGKTNLQNLYELNDKLKNLQVGMVAAGSAVTTALNYVATQINAMGTKIRLEK